MWQSLSAPKALLLILSFVEVQVFLKEVGDEGNSEKMKKG